MRSFAAPRRVLAQRRTIALVLGTTLAVGCGGGTTALPTPEPTATPTPVVPPSDPWPAPAGGLAPAALVMGSWSSDLRSCVIDPDTGALGPCQRPAVGNPGAPNLVTRGGVAPGGRLAVLVVDGSVQAFHIDAAGRMERAGAAPDAAAWEPPIVVLHPVRRLAYVSSGSEVRAYRVSVDGALTPVSGSPFPIAARALVFRPDGAFGYAAGLRDDDRSLTVCRVEESGALATVKTYSSGPAAGERPSRGDLVIDRTGAYLITRDTNVYRIDRRTGELSLVFSDPTEAVTLVAHPEQDFIFRARAASEYSRQLDTLRLDLESGALSVASSVEMLPPHHGGYTLLTVEPRSRSLYHVTTEGIDENMAIYRHAIRTAGVLGQGSRVFLDYAYPADFVPFSGPRS